MPNTIKDNAHAILLPAFADTELSNAVKKFLSNGGCSILVGETREEYVAREVARGRRQKEKAETIIALTDEASSLSGDIIVAIDNEKLTDSKKFMKILVAQFGGYFSESLLFFDTPCISVKNVNSR